MESERLMLEDNINHDKWMLNALSLAAKAQGGGEVPVGAVVVFNNKIIGEGWNRSIGLHDPSAHAEIQAIRAACNSLANYRLPGADLYVTLEPCPMCAGAIIHARINRVIYAAADPRTGAAQSAFQLLDSPKLNHRCEIVSGVMQEQASKMLKDFFRARR